MRTWENEVPATTDHASTHRRLSQFPGEKFHAPAVFAASADRMIETLTSSLPAKGFDRVRLPDGISAGKLRDNQANGILVRDEEWDMALQVAERRSLSIS